MRRDAILPRHSRVAVRAVKYPSTLAAAVRSSEKVVLSPKRHSTQRSFRVIVDLQPSIIAVAQERFSSSECVRNGHRCITPFNREGLIGLGRSFCGEISGVVWTAGRPVCLEVATKGGMLPGTFDLSAARGAEVAELLRNNRLQIRVCAAAGEYLTQTKRREIGQCERVRVN
jgi:hypothetical protein